MGRTANDFRRCVAVAALGVFATVGSRARADTTTTPVRVEVSRGSVCADPAVITERITARGLAVSGSLDTVPVARITVLQRDAGLEGTLLLTRSRGAVTTTRIVTAPTCTEVLDALAFTLALALEGEEPPPARPPPSPPGPPPRSIPPSTAETVDRGAIPAAPRQIELGFGASGGLASGTAPGISTALGAWAMVGVRRAGWFSPSGSLGVMFVLPSEESDSSRHAISALQGATLDLCPTYFGGPSLAVRPCIRGVFGRSQVRSGGFEGARLDQRAFATVGAAARAEARLVGSLFVHLDLTAGIPIERATYFVGNSQVFETPAVALGAGLGLGVHFL